MKFGAEFLRVRDTKDWSLGRRGTLRLRQSAVDRRVGAPLSGRCLERSVTLGCQRPRAVPAAVRHQLPLRLSGRHAPAHPCALVRRHLASRPIICRSTSASARTPTGERPIRPTSLESVILIDNGVESGDFGYKTGIRDLNNVAPRVGFAYNVGGRNDLVIRGGSGLYYNTPVSNVTYSHQFYSTGRGGVLPA